MLSGQSPGAAPSIDDVLSTIGCVQDNRTTFIDGYLFNRENHSNLHSKKIGIQEDKNMIILVMGVSGSGKTTIGKMLAEKLQWQFQDADDFHPPANIAKMKQGIPLTDEDRNPWLEAMQQAILQWSETGKDTVLACSALKKSYREQLCYCKDQVSLVYLKASYDLIKQRLKNRKDHFMNKNLLKSQFETLEEPVQGIHVDIENPPEVVVSQIINRLEF